MSTKQFGRKATLVVQRAEYKGNNPSAYLPASTLDLSSLHIRFKTEQQDVESPNNCRIRVYNLSDQTLLTLRQGEYSRVVLQAGYEEAFGVIFDGTIKQFEVGREDSKTTYLDILAADGDLGYNQAIVNRTLAPGTGPADRVGAALGEMGKYGVTSGSLMNYTGGVLPRGKVLFGMARNILRSEARNQGASWNIANGQVNIVPLDGYLPGEALVLNAGTGLIGLPRQTNQGLVLDSLLNPRITVGGLIKVDNKSVNQTINADPNSPAVAYNRPYAGPQLLADITTDGLYRVLVVEHEGDTRGREWYSKITALAVDPSTKKVIAQ